MTAPVTTVDLYRCPVSGGFNYWAVVLPPSGGLELFSAGPNRRIRQVQVPPEKARDPVLERDRRVQEKLAKGYSPVGPASIIKGRFELTAADQATDHGINHWEIVKPISRDDLGQWLSWIDKQWRETGLLESAQYDPLQVVLTTSCGPSPETRWTFGFCDEGGMHASGRGGGEIRLSQGVMPRLVLLRLMRSFPESIRLGDGLSQFYSAQITRDSEFVGARLFDFDRVLMLAGKLELCLPPLDLLIGADDRSSALWF